MASAASHVPLVLHAVGVLRGHVGRRPRPTPVQGDAVLRRRRRCSFQLGRRQGTMHGPERLRVDRRLLREWECVDAAAGEPGLVGQVGPRHPHRVAGPPLSQLQQQQLRGTGTGLHEVARVEVHIPVDEPVLR